MQEILNQLGGFVVGSVPTMVFFIILIVAYNFLVRRPLDKTLAERRARTSGAMEGARAAISASEAKAAEYESKLRAARAEIYEARQQRLKSWTDEKDKTLADARQQAGQRVATARQAVERSGEEARQQLSAAAAQLSGRILEAILPGGNRQAVQG